jgi:hypothetical protein
MMNFKKVALATVMGVVLSSSMSTAYADDDRIFCKHKDKCSMIAGGKCVGRVPATVAECLALPDNAGAIGVKCVAQEPVPKPPAKPKLIVACVQNGKPVTCPALPGKPAIKNGDACPSWMETPTEKDKINIGDVIQK